MPTMIIDKQGHRREALDGEVLQDGERLFISITMMDSAPLAFHDGIGNAAGHKPGYALASCEAMDASDASYRDAYSKYDVTLTEAWRMPADDNAAKAFDADHDTYAAYEHRLGNAWRSA